MTGLEAIRFLDRHFSNNDTVMSSTGLLFHDHITTLVDVKKQVYQRMAYLG